MSLDGLLAFAAILVAIYAIIDPVQREALKLFVPKRRLIWWLLISFFLIIIPQILAAAGNPLSASICYAWSVLSFLVPVAALLSCALQWMEKRLTEENVGKLHEVLAVSLRENRFDEVEQIFRKNPNRVSMIPGDTLDLFFERRMVRALIESRSFLHLELLADRDFLECLENAADAVDAVIREMVRADSSPLRSAVIREYEGDEYASYTGEDERLVEATLQNPEWFAAVGAHYPLFWCAREELRSGRLDREYNDIGRDYEAQHGISPRSHCVIFLAVKTHVLAIRRAIEKHFEADFYLTDVWGIFGAILERSVYREDVWRNDLANSDYPTPYAYLLYETESDLRDLAQAAIEAAAQEVVKAADDLLFGNLPETPMKAAGPETGGPRVSPPGVLAEQLARSWSLCVLKIAWSHGNVSPDFRRSLIQPYLNFVLQIRHAPGNIIFDPGIGKFKGLEDWGNLFAQRLHRSFVGASDHAKQALKDAMNNLDPGKEYVSAGRNELAEELGIEL